MQNEPTHDLDVEIELLRRVGAGDRLSFAELYDRFAKVLFSTAYRILNNQEATEDVLQDVFVQIWEKAPLYDSTRGRPITWAVTLTRHRAIDYLRATQRRGRLQESVHREGEILPGSDERTSFEAVASGEAGELVIKAMKTLSAEQREAIELAFFKSLTQTEIAERLNLPLGTVKARIRRGMLELRDVLAPLL